MTYYDKGYYTADEDPQFCVECGRAVKREICIDGYNPFTGEPITHV
jgi:hypothetical protein